MYTYFICILKGENSNVIYNVMNIMNILALKVCNTRRGVVFLYTFNVIVAILA